MTFGVVEDGTTLRVGLMLLGLLHDVEGCLPEIPHAAELFRTVGAGMLGWLGVEGSSDCATKCGNFIC